MNNFIIRMADRQAIRFDLYNDAAPATVAAFMDILPFKRIFFHARVSGLEIWTDKAPMLNVPQENVSIFPEPGEIVIGPAQPSRNKIAGFMGISYGEGKLLDGGNIFGKVIEEDKSLLILLGDAIWKGEARELIFECPVQVLGERY